MFFVKYGKEKHLDTLAAGRMRFTPLMFYRQYEKEEEIKSGISDPFEGMAIERIDNLSIVKEDGEKIDYLERIMLGMDFGTTAGIPVFCISAYVDENDWGTHLDLMMEKFPEYTHCLRIDNIEGFIKEIHKESKGMKSGFVTYKEEPVQLNPRNEWEYAFYKRPLFSYQKEYRFVCSNTRTQDPIILTFNSKVPMTLTRIKNDYR